MKKIFNKKYYNTITMQWAMKILLVKTLEEFINENQEMKVGFGAQKVF